MSIEFSQWSVVSYQVIPSDKFIYEVGTTIENNLQKILVIRTNGKKEDIYSDNLMHYLIYCSTFQIHSHYSV